LIEEKIKEEVVVKYLYIGHGEGGKILNETVKSKRRRWN